MTSQRPSNTTSSRSTGHQREGSVRTSKRKATERPSAVAAPQDEPTPSPTGFAKVAIPRLRPEDTSGQDAWVRDAAKVDRTNHACEPCRTRKTKCSGERPICKHCRQFNITCVYADGKRDRIRREQEQMERKLAVYESLLVEAGPSIGANIWSRFQEARSPGRDTVSRPDESLEDLRELMEAPRAEHHRSASEGSMDAVDSVQEDITRSAESQATGYLGKSSDVDWQKGINEKEDVISEQNQSHPEFEPGKRRAKPSVSEMSYQIAREDLPGLSQPDLDIYAVPAEETATYLTSVFFRVVYPSFPLLSHYNFELQLSRAYDGNFVNEAKPNNRWRAIMNLVLAIGTQYLKITNNELSHSYDSHEVFFARAARFGLVGKSLVESADLQQIQIYGLGALYLTAVSRISQAWTLVGLAMRGSVALGLHLEIKTDDLDEFAKEARYRLWWAVYGLDNMLQLVTGRPAAISLNGFSTPLPVPYDESEFDPRAQSSADMSRFMQTSWRVGIVPVGSHPPNITTDAPVSSAKSQGQALANVKLSGSLYFIYRSRVSLIVHDILETLYQPASAHLIWSQVQSGIERFNRALDKWQSELPPEFDFRIWGQQNEWDGCRDRLAYLYYSAAIIANRPCLCEMAEGSAGETKESQDFNARSVRICVESAVQLIQLLPPDFDATKTATNSPWWMIIHCLFSAVTVLTISLFYECRHVGEGQRPIIIQAAKTGLRWLQTLAEDPNEGAQRAWHIAAKTFARIASRMGVDLSDLRLPTRVHDRRESMSQQSGSRISTEASSLQYQERHQPSLFEVVAPGYSDFTDFETLETTGTDWDHLFTTYDPPQGYPSFYPPRGLDLGQVADAHLSSDFASNQSSPLDIYASRHLPPHMMDPYASVGGHVASFDNRSSTAMQAQNSLVNSDQLWAMQGTASEEQQNVAESQENKMATKFSSTDFRRG